MKGMERQTSGKRHGVGAGMHHEAVVYCHAELALYDAIARDHGQAEQPSAYASSRQRNDCGKLLRVLGGNVWSISCASQANGPLAGLHHGSTFPQLSISMERAIPSQTAPQGSLARDGVRPGNDTLATRLAIIEAGGLGVG